MYLLSIANSNLICRYDNIVPICYPNCTRGRIDADTVGIVKIIFFYCTCIVKGEYKYIDINMIFEEKHSNSYF